MTWQFGQICLAVFVLELAFSNHAFVGVELVGDLHEIRIEGLLGRRVEPESVAIGVVS